MKETYDIETAIDFSLINEQDTLNEENFNGDAHCESIRRFFDNLSYYADSYGYTVDEFKEECERRGIKP